MVLFLTRVFLITNSLKVVYLLSKMRLLLLWVYFHIFQRGFEVLNAIFQASVYVAIATAIAYYSMYRC